MTQRHVRGSNVCVIGGCGFLGSHLVDHLIEDRGCNVIVIDNLVTGKTKFLHPKAKFIWHDITHSEDQLRKIFIENEIQFVWNYAAMPYIPFSFARPLMTFDINARGALMALNAAHEAGVTGFLQVSSAEIYGSVDGKINEQCHATPHSTYGASKLAIDTLVQARWKEAKTPAIAMRQFNCLGERETHPYVIPEIISQIHAQPGKTATVRLGNNSFRDFQYAGDAVRMAVELLESGKFGEVYNMGSEEGIQMYDLAKMIGEMMDKEVTVIPDPARMRPWEIWHLQSDNTKLYEAITYRPKNNLEMGLEKTISYFLQNKCKWDF